MRSPILGRLRSVSSRARYIARCLLSTTVRERLSPVISVTETPVESATIDRIRSMVTRVDEVSGMSFRTSWARLTSMGRLFMDEKATTRVRQPSSSRIFVGTREAISMSTSSSARVMRSLCTFFWRMATRVSRSGGWMSVMSPHSKRETRRSSRVARPLGCLSDVMTICFWASYNALKV